MVKLSIAYVQHEYNVHPPPKKSRTRWEIEFSRPIPKNEPMKKSWFPLVAALILAGCSIDKTLESLVPRTALAVVLIDHPSFVAQTLGTGAVGLPWGALDGDKPWAAAIVPSASPGLMLALALADQSSAWATVQAWAMEKGGLVAARVGNYAVLTSPGLPSPTLLDADRRFDLGRVRVGGDPIALYIDVKNVAAQDDLPPALAPALSFLPAVSRDLAGIRVGFSSRDGGIEFRVSTDWREGAGPATLLKTTRAPADLSLWTAFIPDAQGVGIAASIPEGALGSIGSFLHDPALERRWSALAPLLGPRMAFSASPRADGTWAWAAAVEAKDPQAVRQALKTLVAGGEVQRHFTDWALDADTPVIYQDKPDATGVRTQLTLGAATVQLGYGNDRVALAGGAGALESLGVWKRAAATPPTWYHEAGMEASLVAGGAIDGLGARGALRILSDGNLELRVWVAADGLKAWEGRLPQATLSWLSGSGGSRSSKP